MFDTSQNQKNQNLRQGLNSSKAPKMAPPPGLPVGIGEAEDILDGTEATGEQGGASQSIPDKGVLVPQIDVGGGGQSSAQPSSPVVPADQMMEGIEVKKLSGGKKILIIVITGLLGLALIGAGYWLYRRLTGGGALEGQLAPAAENEAGMGEEGPPSQGEFGEIPAGTFENGESGNAVDFREEPEMPGTGSIEAEPPVPVDTDGDGLTDAEERALGTNIGSPDSDNDGLPDRDEVEVYKTDPLNPDSDGDNYLDGEEVEHGYDPKGPGRLFELP